MIGEPLTKDQLAERFGLSRHTISKYVQMGVLPPPNGTGRYASYDNRHVERLEAIWGWNGLKDSNRTLKDMADAWNPLPNEDWGY